MPFRSSLTTLKSCDEGKEICQIIYGKFSCFKIFSQTQILPLIINHHKEKFFVESFITFLVVVVWKKKSWSIFEWAGSFLAAVVNTVFSCLWISQMTRFKASSYKLNSISTQIRRSFFQRDLIHQFCPAIIVNCILWLSE